MGTSLDHLTPEEQEALRLTFQGQAAELLDAINEALLQVEAGRAEARTLPGLQRALHTLKGDAGAFGLSALVRVAHRMEDAVAAAAEGRLALDRDRLGLLFQAADACERLLRGDGEEGGDLGGLEALLAALPPPIGAGGLGPGVGAGPAPGGGEAEAQEAPGAGPGEGLSLSEYERAAAAEAEARGLWLYLLRAEVDPRCRMVGAGAFLLLRHLQGAGEILRSEPPLEGPVPDGTAGFGVLVATALDPESLERRCLLPGIIAAARALPFAVAEGGGRRAEGEADPVLSPAGPEAARCAPGPAPGNASPADGNSPSPVPHPASGEGAPASTLLVDTRRVDRVMNLVGELVIARSMFHQALRALRARLPTADLPAGLGEAERLMERSLADLQKAVMKIRMVPIDRVFRRLPRLVRDLAGASPGAKDARLVLEGRSTELDKGVVDALGEPLVHLIRNAVDHGIEPAAERTAAGKPPAGTVRVAACAEGNQIVIDVEDDGRGIDPAALRRAALAHGLLRAEAAEALDDARALDLIFLPGFSTAAHVTDTSGRGIGMDAVRASLEALKGQIHVASRAGRGTRFTLRVPLTLAIIRGMLFRAAGRLFALPLSTIAEILRVDPAEVRTVDGHEVLRVRDRVLALLRLSQALGIAECGVRSGDGDPARDAEGGPPNPHSPFRNPHLYVVVVALAEQRIGLAVDGLQGEGELVIKALDSGWLTRAPLAGSAILGDGRVVLILDPGALLQRVLARRRAAAPRVAGAPAEVGP